MEQNKEEQKIAGFQARLNSFDSDKNQKRW